MQIHSNNFNTISDPNIIALEWLSIIMSSEIEKESLLTPKRVNDIIERSELNDPSAYIHPITIAKLKSEQDRVQELQERENVIFTLIQETLKLKDINQQLKQENQTDPLTQTLNRRALDKNAKAMFSNSVRHKRHFSLLLIDIDFFKRINDTYGHMIGDQVLTKFASLISNRLRNEDKFGRHGWEEFMILLWESNTDSAVKLAEDIRLLIKNNLHNLITELDESSPITISTGIATLNNWEGYNTYEEMMTCADEELYKAKSAGRNTFSTKDMYLVPDSEKISA